MKPIEKTFKLLLTAAIILQAFSMQAQFERKYFGVEIDGVLCGYATTDISYAEYLGKTVLETNDTVRLMLKALGQDLNAEILKKHYLDPEDYTVLFCNIEYSTSDVGKVMSSTTDIFDTYAIHKQAESGIIDTVPITDGLIFDNPLSSPYLIEDFLPGGADKKTYHVYDFMRGIVAEQIFTLEDEVGIHLAGSDFQTLVFNIYNPKDGFKTRIWVNKEDGEIIQFEIMNRKIYLAESTVAKQISTVDLDNSIFARVDKSIANFMELSYMKVKADINSGGEAITEESLNFKGQKFEGTVDENHIQGVFELEPIWYDGADAPAFPADYSDDESLQKYLEAEMLIESDHPDIISMAEKITEGATDSWDAAVRLSEWVGKEIHGAVPGGTSAINTLRIREGECGSHSRLLAAFCRSAGIPSRMVMGCLYSPWYGGSFGQHGWTEVYMGEKTGWVAVDATILEYGYVDAGHIKLGELTAFHPVSMEILEYRIGDEGLTDAGVPEEYLPLIGQYIHPGNRDVLEVTYMDASLTVDIMGRMKLALNEPDDQGRRYAKLTDQVYFTFEEDTMVVVEKSVAMKRKDVELIIDEETPEEYKAMIGPYMILQIQKEFNVIWNGQLSMLVPGVEEPRKLEYHEESDHWMDVVDHKEYDFNYDDEVVSSMNVYASTELHRGTSAAWIIDKKIKEEGIEAAATTFKELWENRALDLENTEADLNKQGYIYLNEGRFDEALMVFKLNVDAFPQSWNVYDSYAEALMKNGDKDEAIKSYQKSLELNPDNEGAKQMIEKLNSQESE